MAHPEQLEFVHKVQSAFPSFFTGSKTLEIGSLDINGTIRKFFKGGSYTGLDVAEGPGVDVACQGQEYDGPSNDFDTVISCEVMEHNPHWRETMTNMIRICRPGGLVIMTCATIGRKEHGTTRTDPADSPLSVGLGWEYYKNLTARDFKTIDSLRSDLDFFSFFTNWASRDLYFLGFKKGATPPTDARKQFAIMRRHYIGANLASGLRSDYLRVRTLIALFGEERYWAGPIRLW
ncbi:class I SAM-dependent methyltransferase [Acidisphaera sp. S103]|uniref:class I SAM-dependent methyltransferase n=1 Tax=Acidisphaera sp. S103 TaxID=1747223 RepID=UPI00131C410F|nr:class I SAM-dependent methyltransferase [Acidisphaera sp. S103]